MVRSALRSLPKFSRTFHVLHIVSLYFAGEKQKFGNKLETFKAKLFIVKLSIEYNVSLVQRTYLSLYLLDTWVQSVCIAYEMVMCQQSEL